MLAWQALGDSYLGLVRLTAGLRVREQPCLCHAWLGLLYMLLTLVHCLLA